MVVRIWGTVSNELSVETQTDVDVIKKMKLTLKVVVHIVVYVALVVVWFVAFGDESLRKYNEKAVIVTEHEEYLGYVPQPGMSL